MNFQVTVRYGSRYQRYHTFEVDVANARDALAAAATRIPEEIAREADLVEVRVAVDPDDRPHPGGT